MPGRCIQIYAHTSRPEYVTSPYLVNRPPVSPLPLSRARPSVDRVNRVKSARHASRSNRLAEETPNAPLYGPTAEGGDGGGRYLKSYRESTPECAHRWSSLVVPSLFLSLCRRTFHPVSSPLPSREYLAVKFIFFLVEQCNQPWHSQNYATQVERGTRRFSCRRSRRRARRRGGCADANRGRKFVAPMESAGERRKAVGRKRACTKERESYFDFTSGAICVRKPRHDASKRRIALRAVLDAAARERYNPLCAPSI